MKTAFVFWRGCSARLTAGFQQTADVSRVRRGCGNSLAHTDAHRLPRCGASNGSSALRAAEDDFEHHGMGKAELNVKDPAYDLADIILESRTFP